MDGSDAGAVARARAGDHDAFRALVERYSPKVFRLAYRMTGNEQDAEDVVQETFLRVYRRLSQFESRANFGTWLYRIGVNTAFDQMRGRQRRMGSLGQADPEGDGPALEVASRDPQPDRLALSNEVRRELIAALAILAPKEKAAFVLRHFEGMSIDEISGVLGLRANAAKNCIFRAVQKLRARLAPLRS